LREGWGDGVPPALPATTPSATLYLIGTVHGDPRGYARAWKLFGYLRPEFITVEISRFSLRYRRLRERRWQRRLAGALEELPVGAGSIWSPGGMAEAWGSCWRLFSPAACS
jgi:hypothetical protein